MFLIFGEDKKMTEQDEENIRTRLAGIICIIILVVIIVLCFVRGKQGPQGSKGLLGEMGPSGYSTSEMGPMGDTGPMGPTGNSGVRGYNKWIAVSISSDQLPYPNYPVNNINYYWNSNSSDNMHLYIDGTKYKPGDMFTIVSLNTHAKLYINPKNFQNMGNDTSKNYWLIGGIDQFNTALIIITAGDTTSNPDAVLINIAYSTILTFNILACGGQ